MAKRTKQATARKAKAPKGASKKTSKKTARKVAKKAKTKKKAARRPLKTKAKGLKIPSKAGRSSAKSGAKKLASRRRRPLIQQAKPQPEMMIVETPQTETTIVDVIEEPVPGVFVVTEFVETNAEPEPVDSLDSDQTVGPKSQEQ